MTTSTGLPERKTIRLACAILAILLLTFVFHAIIPVNSSAIGSIFLITVLVIAASWGLPEAVAASVAATTCFNYFYLPPTYTWTIADPDNWVALFTLLASSLVASQLSDREKKRAIEAMNRRVEIERLYALSRALMLIDTQKHVAKRTAEEVARIYEISLVAVYDSRTGEIHSTSAAGNVEAALREAVPCGSSITVGQQNVFISPLILADRTIGSFAIKTGTLSDAALDALGNLIALSLESARSREIATRAEAERQSEQFKSTLLDGLAHEFKTPLTSIKAVTTAVLTGSVSNSEQQRELLTIVGQEAERLSQLVTEAIHLARIEAGKIQLKRESHSVVDIVERTLEQTVVARSGRPMEISIAENLPEIAIDRELIQLAIRQLLDNACKYSLQRSPIRITVTRINENIAIGVHNWGNTLTEPERVRIFDKFYRGQNAQQLAGAGMGLAIAREILRSHGGDIRVESSPERGTEFLALLPYRLEKELRNEFVANIGS